MSSEATVPIQGPSEQLFYGYNAYTSRPEERGLMERVEKRLKGMSSDIMVLGISRFDTTPYDDVVIDDEAFHVEQLTKDTKIPIPDEMVQRARKVKAAGINFTASLLITRINVSRDITRHEIVGLIQTDKTPGKERCLMISLGEWVEET